MPRRVSIRRTKQERSQAHGQEKDRLLVKLLQADAPYEEVRRALLDMEKRWLREAQSPAERLTIRRTIAEDIVSEAFSANQPWKVLSAALRRVQRLGFSNLALRFHIACLYVQSLRLYPQQAQEAWTMLDDARRRLLRLRRDRPLRKEGLNAIAISEERAGDYSPGLTALLEPAQSARHAFRREVGGTINRNSPRSSSALCVRQACATCSGLLGVSRSGVSVTSVPLSPTGSTRTGAGRIDTSPRSREKYVIQPTKQPS